MGAKLVIEEGPLKGESLALENGESWVIGSDPACQLKINDPEVSGQHLLIHKKTDGFTVEKIHVEDRVQVNEEDLDEEPYYLQNGDVIQIGQESLSFYEDSLLHFF